MVLISGPPLLLVSEWTSLFQSYRLKGFSHLGSEKLCIGVAKLQNCKFAKNLRLRSNL